MLRRAPSAQKQPAKACPRTPKASPHRLRAAVQAPHASYHPHQRPASKPANLRSTRGADRKAIVLKCNKKVSQVRDYQQEPPLPKPGAAAEEDDDGYWQRMLHAKCDARFYTSPHPHMVPPAEILMGP